MGRSVALWAVIAMIALAGGAEAAVGLPAHTYRTAAERVCTTANARLTVLPAPRTSAEVRTWVARAVPIVIASSKRLRTLTPPARLRARHRAWGVALARRSAAARALRARIAAGAPPVAALGAALPRLNALKRAARVRARALGLRTCAGRPRR